MSRLEEAPSHVNTLGYIPPYTSLHNQVERFCGTLSSLKEKSCCVSNHPCASSFRCPALWFPRREETGVITMYRQNNRPCLTHVPMGNMQSCSMVSAPTKHRWDAFGLVLTQKTVKQLFTD